MLKHVFALLYALFAATGIATGDEPLGPATQHSGIVDAVWRDDEAAGRVSPFQTPAGAGPGPYDEEPARSLGFQSRASPSQPPPEITPADSAGAVAVQPSAEKPPPNPYKGVFYDNDFSYLDDPTNDYYYLGDFMKRRRLWGSLMLDVGGEYRLRQNNQHVLMRHDSFLLHRTRVYGDLHFDDRFRAYIEAIDATSEWANLVPRLIDENRFDALNVFGDFRLVEGSQGALWLRGGRQELLYGNERLISPSHAAGAYLLGEIPLQALDILRCGLNGHNNTGFRGKRLSNEKPDVGATVQHNVPGPHLARAHPVDVPLHIAEQPGQLLAVLGWEPEVALERFPEFVAFRVRPDPATRRGNPGLRFGRIMPESVLDVGPRAGRAPPEME
jgi:hypothetical protein